MSCDHVGTPSEEECLDLGRGSGGQGGEAEEEAGGPAGVLLGGLP